jgi:hypothetical protein
MPAQLPDRRSRSGERRGVRFRDDPSGSHGFQGGDLRRRRLLWEQRGRSVIRLWRHRDSPQLVLRRTGDLVSGG